MEELIEAKEELRMEVIEALHRFGKKVGVLNVKLDVGVQNIGGLDLYSLDVEVRI